MLELSTSHAFLSGFQPIQLCSLIKLDLSKQIRLKLKDSTVAGSPVAMGDGRKQGLTVRWGTTCPGELACRGDGPVLEFPIMSARNTDTIPSHIFREYDIRGIAVESKGKAVELTWEFTEGLGQAVATMLGKKRPDGKPRVVIGRDARPSGEKLAQALASGLNKGGADVIDIGMVPTR